MEAGLILCLLIERRVYKFTGELSLSCDMKGCLCTEICMCISELKIWSCFQALPHTFKAEALL